MTYLHWYYKLSVSVQHSIFIWLLVKIILLLFQIRIKLLILKNLLTNLSHSILLVIEHFISLFQTKKTPPLQVRKLQPTYCHSVLHYCCNILICCTGKWLFIWLRCMHTHCTQTTQNYCPPSLRVAIEYICACYNLHHYPQMEQFDWSEMTYYNIIYIYIY